MMTVFQHLGMLLVVVSLSVATTVAPGRADQEACQNGTKKNWIEICTKLIESGKSKGRDLAELYHFRARAFLAAKKPELAIADVSRAIEVAPDFANSYSIRASLYYSRKDYQKAIADFTAALKFEPDNNDHLYLRADSYRHLGKLPQAIADLERARELKPEWYKYHLELGNLYQRTGHGKDATASWLQGCKTAVLSTDVGKWQKSLKKQGYYEGKISGRCDDETISAFRKCAEARCWFN